jgi:hypothetical protein
VRHVLVSSARSELVEGLRAVATPSTVFLAERGLDETLERLGRSARIDAVVTDDPEIAAAIREEIPGNFPLYLVREDEEPAAVWAGLERLLEA